MNVVHELIPSMLLYQRLNKGEGSSVQIGLNTYNTIFVLSCLFEMTNNHEILVHMKKMFVSLTHKFQTH